MSSDKPTCTEAEMLAAIRVGNRVWFAEERMPYTVQARSGRYIICTKPFAPRRTVIYSIIDTQRLKCGPDNMVFCAGYETREDCEERLGELMDPYSGTELSGRRSVPLNIRKVQE